MAIMQENDWERLRKVSVGEGWFLNWGIRDAVRLLIADYEDAIELLEKAKGIKEGDDQRIARLETYTGKVVELEQSLEVQKAKTARLERQLAIANSQLVEGAEKKIDEAERTIRGLMQTVDKTNAAIKNAMAEVEPLKRDMDRVIQENGRLKRECDTAQRHAEFSETLLDEIIQVAQRTWTEQEVLGSTFAHDDKDIPF